MRQITRALLIAAMAILLWGCAVKPSPFTDKENAARLVADRSLLFKDQQQLEGPLSLCEAVARALAYNFDNRMAMFESVLQDKQLDVANVSMLPRLAANAGFSVRNNELASSSVSYNTRQTTLEPSVSQQQARFTPDISLSWSILDFGISYFQAKQQADRSLVAMERRRRVVNNIVQEVIAAWWKASTAQRLLPLIGPVTAETEAALALLQRQDQNPLMPVLNTLEMQKSMLQTISRLRRIESDLSVAKTQLAALVNLPPSGDFTLADPPASAWNLPELDVKIENLETLGLFYRPDLREEMYQERIDRNNVWKVLISYLPGVSQVSSLNYDNNIYLVNNLWAEVGVRATASLMSLVQAPRAIKAAKAQVEVDKARRLALTMAALVQINLSRLNYLRAARLYRDASALTQVDEQILKVVTDGVNARAEPELERARREAATIMSTYERDQDLADAYRALGNMYFSVGADIVPLENRVPDLSGLASVVESHMDAWRSGIFPNLPEEAGLEPEGRLKTEGDAAKAEAPLQTPPTGKDAETVVPPLKEATLDSKADPLATQEADPTVETAVLLKGRKPVPLDQARKEDAAKDGGQPKKVIKPVLAPQTGTEKQAAAAPPAVSKDRKPVPLDQARQEAAAKDSGQPKKVNKPEAAPQAGGAASPAESKGRKPVPVDKSVSENVSKGDKQSKGAVKPGDVAEKHD